MPTMVAGASFFAPISESRTYNIGFMTLSLPQSVVATQADLVPVVSASLDALLFILVQMMYLRHVLLRPYISVPSSSSSFDSVNEAEMMGVRVLCWGAFIFAAKVLISSVSSTTVGDWFGNAVCAIFLLAIVISHWPLFRSVAKGVNGVKELASIRISRDSSAEGSNRPKPESSTFTDAGGSALRGSQAPDGAAADDAIKDTIQAMLDSDSPIEVLQLQKKMTMMLHLLPARERPRWMTSSENKNEPRRTVRVLRRVGVVMLVVLAAALFSLVLAVIFRCSCLTKHVGWVYLLLLSGVMMLMETMIWKSRVDEQVADVAKVISDSKNMFELVENPMVARGKG